MNGPWQFIGWSIVFDMVTTFLVGVGIVAKEKVEDKTVARKAMGSIVLIVIIITLTSLFI